MKHFSLFLIGVIIILAGCGERNYRQVMAKPERLFYAGQYKKAAKLLLPEINSGGINELLFQVEGGYMLHAGGDYKTSNKIFLKAGKVAQVKPISISQQINAFMTNTRNTNYRGEDYEKVLIHMYTGLNFLILGDMESARVEFKAVNIQLARVKDENGSALYKQNIMAKYLTALCYEHLGTREKDDDDLEFAYIEYQQIYKLDNRLRFVLADLQRTAKKLNYNDDYKKWTAILGRPYREAGRKGELILFFQSGKIAIKKSRGRLLADPMMKRLIRTAFMTNSRAGVSLAMVFGSINRAKNPIPKLLPRSNRVSHAVISVDGKEYKTIELENISRTAYMTLKSRYPELRKNMAAQITVKAIASLAAGIVTREAVRRRSGSRILGDLLGMAAGAGTSAALFSSMKPDLRCWHTLPASLQISRIPLDPGSHSVTISYIGKNGDILETMTEDVTIPESGIHVISKRSIY
jgi:uncharacterized protein